MEERHATASRLPSTSSHTLTCSYQPVHTSVSGTGTKAGSGDSHLFGVVLLILISLKIMSSPQTSTLELYHDVATFESNTLLSRTAEAASFEHGITSGHISLQNYEGMLAREMLTY